MSFYTLNVRLFPTCEKVFNKYRITEKQTNRKPDKKFNKTNYKKYGHVENKKTI